MSNLGCQKFVQAVLVPIGIIIQTIIQFFWVVVGLRRAIATETHVVLGALPTACQVKELFMPFPVPAQL